MCKIEEKNTILQKINKKLIKKYLSKIKQIKNQLIKT